MDLSKFINALNQEITVSIFGLTIAFGSRNEGIPYKRTPPEACSDSNRVT